MVDQPVIANLRGDTINAREFLAANLTFAVVEGEAIGTGGQGAYYTLENEKRFTLSAEECRFIGRPRWSFDEPGQAD